MHPSFTKAKIFAILALIVLDICFHASYGGIPWGTQQDRG